MAGMKKGWMAISGAALFAAGAASAQLSGSSFPVSSRPPAVFDTHAAERIPFAPPPNIRGQSAWIPLHHQRQETNLCVPTSASIILDYFGQQVNPREIKELSLGREYSPGAPFDDFTITLFSDLISGLRRIGFTWRARYYPDSPEGLRHGLADIERSLDDGIPVMIDTSPLSRHSDHVEGHTFVVAGYSEPRHALYVVDPNRPAPGLRVVGLQELASIWNSLSVGFDQRGAVFPKRR